MKNIKLLAFWAVFLLSAFVSAWASTNFSGGDGTENSPYLISSIDDLKAFADRVNNGFNCKTIDYEDVCEREYFKLTADIDFNPQNSWNEAASSNENNFAPIGYDSEHLFKGEFDGQGHTIRGLRINNTDYERVGLFGALDEGSVVTNVRLANAVIKGYLFVGGIAGFNREGAISGCIVDSVFVRGEVDAGGIVGVNHGTLSNNFAVHVHISGRNLEENVTGCNLIGMGVGYGAIIGHVDGWSLSKNYYSACTYNGVENATNVGIGGFDRDYESDQCVLSPHDAKDAAVGVFAVTLGEDVSITSSENSACIENGKSVYCMPNVKLTLSVDENHLIDEITGVDATITDDKLYAEFTMPSEDVTISATTTSYSDLYTVNVPDGLTISDPYFIIGNIIMGSKKFYRAGDEVTLTADDGKLIVKIDGVDATIAANKKSAKFKMPNKNVEISATLSKIWGDGEGTKENPFTIASAFDLDLLASLVNSGNGFENTYFEVIEDISYDATNAADGNNYTAIGTSDHRFWGKFNGNGHTIRGIRINKPDDEHQGLFGVLDGGAEVQKVTLVDVVITGKDRVGGIVGLNVGGSLSDNLVIGATISAARNYGAIIGENHSSLLLQNNYYMGCTVAGVENATNAGIGNNVGIYDIRVNNGAVSIHTIILGDDMSIESPKEPAYIDNNLNNYYAAGTQVTLSFTPPDDRHFSYTVNGTRIPSDKFLMLAENVEVSVDYGDYWGIGKGADGSVGNPYKIATVDDLNILASFVNLGESYEGKHFVLVADIEYSHDTWENAATSIENNFTAIGTRDCPFKGEFYGDGHTIRGIRIYKPIGVGQGLFGVLDKGAAVKKVRLADVVITGWIAIGGIAGINDQGEISNCTVDSVLIKYVNTAFSNNIGGIVGADNGGTLSDNFVIGATIPTVRQYGAIVGQKDGTLLSNNFYIACTAAGVENASNVGIGELDKNNEPITHDVTENNGAVAVFAVTIGEGLSITTPETPVYTDSDKNVYYKPGEEVTLTTTKVNYLIDAITGVEATIAADKKSAKFKMPNKDVEISATLSKIWGDGDGTKENPFTIASVLELDALASLVNSGNSFKDTYFEVIEDISYDATKAVDGNNYTAIGTSDHRFWGKFNGNGHTIRGIRINKPHAWNQGLFGVVGEISDYNGEENVDGAVVENVKLADAVIIGWVYVGGIVGGNRYGEIRNCTVESSVKIYGNQYQGGIVGYNHGIVSGCISYATISVMGTDFLHAGGIVGYNYGIVSGCISSVTITVTETNVFDQQFGGIAGGNSGTLNDNFVIGATILVDEEFGAIVGYNEGSLSNNFYTASSVAGVENATNVGVGGWDENNDPISYDVTDDNGAVSVSVTASAAVEKLVYNGSSQNLVTAGETNYGTMYYSLDGKDYSPEIPAATDAKIYTVYYKVMKEEKWTVFDAKTVEVKIAQAPLTVTAKNKIIAYGDDPANDGVEYSGFIGEENESVLGGKLTYSYDYKKLDKVGKYTIMPSGLTSGNYEISFVAGALNVEPKATHYAAVQVLEDENGKCAEIDGEYGEGDGIVITEPLEVASVEFSRDFSTQGYSTIVLPFDVNTSKLSGVDSVLSFARIVKEQGEMAVGMKVVWEASASHVKLKANTPYMVKMTGAKLGIDGGVTLLPTKAAVTKSDVQNDGWEFRGTYAYKSWQEGDEDLCRVYGFAGGSNDEVSEGDFVKFTAGASLRPLRAYLINTNRTCVAPQKARANGDYVLRAARYSIDDLPESMRVVIVGEGGHTTVIGHFNTRTGVFTNAGTSARKFDLKGRPVQGKPSARGAYYGKRVKK